MREKGIWRGRERGNNLRLLPGLFQKDRMIGMLVQNGSE